MHTFDVQLADVDRGVYESFAIKAARHPSESEDYLVTRVLAYCLEFTEGIQFSRGLAEPDEPAITIKDLTGTIRSWIEVGSPDATRLHKASKGAPRVCVYPIKDAANFVRLLAGERIHRAEQIEIQSIDRELVTEFAARLERRMEMDISVTDRHVFLTTGGATLSGGVTRHGLQQSQPR